MSVLSFRALKLLSISGILSNKMWYYAVAKGRKIGIYETWDECKAQVFQYSKPIYKKFPTKEAAEDFIMRNSGAMKESSNCGSTSEVFGASRIESSEAKNAIPLGKNKGLTAPFQLSLELKRKQTMNNGLSRPSKRIALSPTDKITASDPEELFKLFIIDNDGYVNVYTDGSCIFNGDSKQARAGIGVWFNDNHPLNISQPVVGRASNNRAEIHAVIVAAKQAKLAGVKKLKINTDSEFLINCITKWMPNWKRRGWITVTGAQVKNQEELQEMEEAIESLDVIWNHVNSHVGLHGNEMADQFAKAGALRY